MTKRTKKNEGKTGEQLRAELEAEVAKVDGDGTYHVVFPGGVFGEIEVVKGKFVATVNGVMPDYFGVDNGELTVEQFLRCEATTNGEYPEYPRIGVKKDAPEATAIAPEAGSSTDQDVQTTDSIAKKKNIRKPVLRTLRFPLSAPEIELKCSGIAKKSRAVDELESELACIKADYKGRIEKLQMEIKRDLTAVEEREEPREVMADEVHDFEAAMVRYEYLGETYEQREMTPRERQLEIDGVL